MGRVTIRDVGQFGIITDIPYHEMPPEAWSSGRNIQFIDKKVKRIQGETAAFGTVLAAPKYVFPAPNATQPFWVYTTNTNAYCTVGSSHFDITRASGGNYTGGDANRWNGDWLNGILILNNGVDVPQMWNPISSGQKLAALSNWNTNDRASVIRQFQNFLIALDVTKTGTRYPTMFKWSHPADPGTVPVTWDPADATKLAGELPVPETAGFVVDGKALGQVFMIYKEDAIFRAVRIQTNDIFDLKSITLAAGIMAQQCVQEFQPGKHIVFTRTSDVVVTDGSSVVSVLDEKNRVLLDKRLDSVNRTKCFITVNYKSKEVYIAYPLAGSSYCNEMAVWDWTRGSWSFRDLTDCLDIKSGIYDPAAVDDTWDSDNQPWDLDNSVWDERLYTANAYSQIGAFPTSTALRQFAFGSALGANGFTSRLERLGLSVIGQNRDGTPRNDPNVTKLVTEVYPLMRATNSMTMNVYVGAQDRPDGVVTWEGPYPFNPTTMEKIDCFVEGRYIGMRFESSDQVDWELNGYGLKIDTVGEYL